MDFNFSPITALCKFNAECPDSFFSAPAGRPEAGSLHASCPEARRWRCPASRKENRRFPAVQQQNRRRTMFGRKQGRLPEHALCLLIWSGKFNGSCTQAPPVTMRRIMCAVVRRQPLCFPFGGLQKSMQQVALASAAQGKGGVNKPCIRQVPLPGYRHDPRERGREFRPRNARHCRKSETGLQAIIQCAAM